MRSITSAILVGCAPVAPVGMLAAQGQPAARTTGDRMYDVDGDPTTSCVAKPVTAKVEFCGAADMGRGRKAGFEAQFTVERSDFGVTHVVDKGAIGDDVKAVVGLEGGIAK